MTKRIDPTKHWQGVEKRKTVVRPGKNFIPGKPVLPVDRFQELLNKRSGKLILGMGLISQYGLQPLVKLGDNLLLQPSDRAVLEQKNKSNDRVLKEISFNREHKLSDYLYANCIHPDFFIDVVHLLGTKAKVLREQVVEIKLRQLGRDPIGQEISGQRINLEDLNDGNFKLFRSRPVAERLGVLETIGVLIMKPGQTYIPPQLDLFRKV